MMWKTFGGRCIYQTKNGDKVYQNFRYRWLTLGSSAIQTLINRRHPEKPELGYIHQLAFVARAKPGHCCLLGLGGAAIAHTLANSLGSYQMIAVENNQDIIAIAEQYFMSKRIPNLAIVHQDADIYVKHCDTLYQHVIVDLFDAHSFPVHCNTHDFFAQCARILLPDGVLAVNLANGHEQWPIFELIKHHFHNRTISLPVKGSANLVILACKSPSIAPMLDFLKQSHHLKKLLWDPRWGCIAHMI